MQEPLPPFLTVSEVAMLLRINRNTVVRMIKDKQLAGKKVRGQWRIHRSSVEPYLKG